MIVVLVQDEMSHVTESVPGSRVPGLGFPDLARVGAGQVNLLHGAAGYRERAAGRPQRGQQQRRRGQPGPAALLPVLAVGAHGDRTQGSDERGRIGRPVGCCRFRDPYRSLSLVSWCRRRSSDVVLPRVSRRGWRPAARQETPAPSVTRT
jgi:hypothetical protein